MTLSELKTKARFLTNTSSDTYEDNDIEMNINDWYKRVVSWIWEATGTWEYDDSNKTTLPVATADLGDGREDYTLPTDSQMIVEIEVKDNDGNWHGLDEIDKSEMDTPSEKYEDDGLPKFYDLIGNSAILYPTPSSSDVTISNGLRVHVSRNVDKLSATTDKPGFNKQFHVILAYGAALDWCIAFQDSNKEVDIRRQIIGDSTTAGLKTELRNYYGRRNRDSKRKLNPSKQNYN